MFSVSASAAPMTRSVRPLFTVTSIMPSPRLAVSSGTDTDAGAGEGNVRSMPQRTKPPAFSSYLYKLRNLVERFFSKIKHYPAVATRYDKHPENYLAVIKLAAARIWMRFMSR